MPKSSPPRRKHQHKWTPGSALLPDRRDKLAADAYQAIADFEAGKGTGESRQALVYLLQVVGVAAQRKEVPRQIKLAIRAGQHALIEADKRYLVLNTWGLTLEGMAAVRQAVKAADVVLRRVETGIVGKAIVKVRDLAQAEQP